MSTVPATARIHPKLRRRRVEVQRAAGRRRLRLVLALLSAICVLASLIAIVYSPILDLDRVRWVGTSHLNVRAAQARAGLTLHTPLLRIDLNRVVAEVETEPWVQRAYVQRHLPGTVSIRVLERTPVAVVAGKGVVAMVDGDGRVLSRGTQAGLVSISSDVAVPTAGQKVSASIAAPATLLATLPDANVAQVREIRVAAGGEAEATVTAGNHEVKVLLGDPSAPQDKARALATMLQRVDFAGVTVLDLRAPRVPVLTRATPATTVSTAQRG